jgi:hypothetical protein
VISRVTFYIHFVPFQLQSLHNSIKDREIDSASFSLYSDTRINGYNEH